MGEITTTTTKICQHRSTSKALELWLGHNGHSYITYHLLKLPYFPHLYSSRHVYYQFLVRCSLIDSLNKKIGCGWRKLTEKHQIDVLNFWWLLVPTANVSRWKVVPTFLKQPAVEWPCTSPYHCSYIIIYRVPLYFSKLSNLEINRYIKYTSGNVNLYGIFRRILEKFT